jgi:hypothetical protein
VNLGDEIAGERKDSRLAAIGSVWVEEDGGPPHSRLAGKMTGEPVPPVTIFCFNHPTIAGSNPRAP